MRRGILYKHHSSLNLELLGYVDSNYAGDLDRTKSLIRNTFLFGGNIVSRKSSLQPVVALSTTRVEFIAAGEAVKEAIWLKGILKELDFKQQSTNILCNNQSSIHLSKNNQFHDRSKHIDVQLHFIRDEIEKGTMNIIKVKTEDNALDMLTKAFNRTKFEQCLKLLKVIDLLAL